MSDSSNFRSERSSSPLLTELVEAVGDLAADPHLYSRFRIAVLNGDSGAEVHESLNEMLALLGHIPLPSYGQLLEVTPTPTAHGDLHTAAIRHYVNAENNPNATPDVLFAQTGAALLQALNTYILGPKFEQRLDVMARRAIFSQESFDEYSKVMTGLAGIYIDGDAAENMAAQLRRIEEFRADYIPRLQEVLGDEYPDFLDRMDEEFESMEASIGRSVNDPDFTLFDLYDNIDTVAWNYFPGFADEIEGLSAFHEMADDLGRATNYPMLVAATPVVYSAGRSTMQPDLGIFEEYLASYDVRPITVYRDEYAPLRRAVDTKTLETRPEALKHAMAEALVIGRYDVGLLVPLSVRKSSGWTAAAVPRSDVPAAEASTDSAWQSGSPTNETMRGHVGGEVRTMSAALMAAAGGAAALWFAYGGLAPQDGPVVQTPPNNPPAVAPDPAPSPMDRYFDNHGDVQGVKKGLLVEAPGKEKEVDQMVEALHAGQPAKALELAKTHLRYRSNGNPKTKDFLRITAATLVQKASAQRDGSAVVTDPSALREGAWTLVWTENDGALKLQARQSAEVADQVAANGGVGWSDGHNSNIADVVENAVLGHTQTVVERGLATP